MPNKKAAFKSLRQDKKKHENNKATISELRTLAKKARLAIGSKKTEDAEAALKKLESKLDKAAKANTIKKNAAARKISRLRSQMAKTC